MHRRDRRCRVGADVAGVEDAADAGRFGRVDRRGVEADHLPAEFLRGERGSPDACVSST